MKMITPLFLLIFCASALVSSQTLRNKPKQGKKVKSTAAVYSTKSRSTLGLELCSVVDNRRGGVWITGHAYLHSGLILSDRDGAVNPVVVSGAIQICDPVFVTADVGWLIDGFSLYRTGNAGLSWQEKAVPGLSDVRSIHFLNWQNGWVGGFEGQIYRTADGGEQWTKSNIPLKYQIKQIFFTDTLRGWALAFKYVSPWLRMRALFRTDDGGESWEQLSDGDADERGSVESFVFLDRNNGWGIEGWQHNVIRTTDGGETWTIQKPFPEASWNTVFFKDALNGWIVGDGIAHTSDGGVTWEYQLRPPTPAPHFTRITFIDEKHGWAVANDRVVRTNNGGMTWEKLPDTWQGQLPDYNVLVRQVSKP